MTNDTYKGSREVYLVEFYGDYHCLVTAKRLQALLKSGELLGERVDIKLEKLGKDLAIPSDVLADLHAKYEETGLGISPLYLKY